MRVRAQAEIDEVEVEYVSAPHEYEELLLAPKEEAQEDGDADADGHMGLGASSGGGAGGLGFVSAGQATPGLGSSGAAPAAMEALHGPLAGMRMPPQAVACASAACPRAGLPGMACSGH